MKRIGNGHVHYDSQELERTEFHRDCPGEAESEVATEGTLDAWFLAAVGTVASIVCGGEGQV